MTQELEQEMEKFNQEPAVIKMNEELEKNIIAANMTSTTMSNQAMMAPLPNPLLAELNVEHRESLKEFAKENNYMLVYEHLCAQDEDMQGDDLF